RPRRRDHAGHRLNDRVIPRIAAARTVAAKAGDPTMHQPRKLRPQHLIGDAPFVERSRLEILDQHVGALQHLHQHGATALSREVQPDRTFVAVYAYEIRRVVAMKRWPPVADLVACGW